MTYKDKGSYESSPPCRSAYTTDECVTLDLWTSHLWMPYERVMSRRHSNTFRTRSVGIRESWHVCMRHARHTNESCQTYEGVTSKAWMSHVRNMQELCWTYKWGMSDIWMIHAIYEFLAIHICEWQNHHLLMTVKSRPPWHEWTPWNSFVSPIHRWHSYHPMNSLEFKPYL